ncbi:hypothetical protein [Pseudomonas paralcaligenes]|uniref:hypothetical protein n=1 Tax=Pseudomonas paralcaligenes TaxID=2772558 RepID=UPI001C8078D6|nr:hypothetical protein [Pseudomonas paralcaligenes]
MGNDLKRCITCVELPTNLPDVVVGAADYAALEAECEQLRTGVAYYRSTLRNVLKDIRDDLVRGGLPPSWAGIAETISVALSIEGIELHALKAQEPAKFSEESAAPGIYAILYCDNWDGHGDTYYCIAQKEESGQWVRDENGAELLQYAGDEILRAWRLDVPPAAHRQAQQQESQP